MKKIVVLICILFLTGCSIVRIDTKSIDNIIDVVLSKNNTLYNQIGKGYKYYIPRGVTYIESDDFNDKLYCNGSYYYLYIDAVSYYNKIATDVEKENELYYYKKISKKDFKSDGYLKIAKQNSLYRIEFVYNYARFETIVDKDSLNQTILNASYILSTIKFNKKIVDLSLNEDYFINKEEKYNSFSNYGETTKFDLNVETKKEG